MEPHDPNTRMLALADMSLARLPGQFRLSVTSDRQWVRHEIAAWSIGLRWLTFDFENVPLDPKSPLFELRRDEAYLALVEQQSFLDWMLPHFSRHLEMHKLANSIGLASGGDGLPVEQILVDQLTKDILVADSVDLHAAADTMATDSDYIKFLCNSMNYMRTFVGARRFELTQVGDRLPELSAEVRIDEHVIYHGHALDVDLPIPLVILSRMAGRRLGDLLSTGMADLDRRVVTGVATDRDDWSARDLPDGWVRLHIEPELVPLGSRSGSDQYST